MDMQRGNPNDGAIAQGMATATVIERMYKNYSGGSMILVCSLTRLRKQ